MKWKVEEYENNISERSVRVVDEAGKVIADNEPYYPQALDPKNAHLIAAAPAMLEALKFFVTIMRHCTVSDGVCCCGDSMENHADPMWSGHSPVDHGQYTADGALETAATIIAAAEVQS